MISFRRSYKRPYQQVLLLLWTAILCIWIFASLHAATSSGTSIHDSEDKADQWSRFKSKIPIVGSPLPVTNTHDDTNQSHLQQRPLPAHASQPDFPNVPVAVHLPAEAGPEITAEEVEQYVTNIWDLKNSQFWRTECDGQDHLPKRYEVLKELAESHRTSQVKYFFALDLFEVRKVLPRLMGSLAQVIKLLGPEKCSVSIVEGRSDDGTYAILSAVKTKLEEIGTKFYLVQSSIDPHKKGGNRISALAQLRNMALEPLIAGSKSSGRPPMYNHETIITFINDIAVCPEDIYELLFQHIYQNAHQTCAMDWVSGGDLFYDSWVSRSMSGDLFFEVPQDLSFAFSENMFWDHPLSKKKYNKHQPFQVYSCWGGMITLSSSPFIDGQIQIRNSTESECYAGEPLNLARDLWKLGYGKILTVPTVNVGYSSPETSRIKKRKGWVHTHVNVTQTEEEWKGTELIEWKVKPPGQVKCMPGWATGVWNRWSDT